MLEKQLFEGITKDHVIQAINRINEEGFPPSRDSSLYDLEFSGVVYPPKYVLSLAGYFRDRKFIGQKDFAGGESNIAFQFLMQLGFTIKSKSETTALKKPKQEHGVSRKYWDTELLDEESPAFFTIEDFIQLRKYVGQAMNRSNSEMTSNYEYTRKTYDKIEYWANQIQKHIFPKGIVSIRKRPTNQANNFGDYLWAKLYPNKQREEERTLAFTVSLSEADHFCVKIDTVGLGDDDSFRKKYLKLRGEDFFNSPIVSILKTEDILKRDWNYLIKTSCEIIQSLESSYNYLLGQIDNTSLNDSSEESGARRPDSTSLNLILYGPPGTGKTYNTINKAVELANPDFAFNDKTREQVKKEYERLYKLDRIEFVTFHQSLSYEDFIEGLKPQKPETKGDQVIYDIEPGVFRRISERAKSNWFESKSTNRTKLNFELAFRRLVDDWGDNPTMKFPLKTEGYEYTITGFTNTSIQFKKASGGTSHTLSINTLKNLYYGQEYDFKQGVGIYYPSILRKLSTYQPEDTKIGKPVNYVLIIDEINRGNVSQIFGELITLIEDDKRLGRDEQLEVMLPYSKERFGIPPNLYIIGTMNTADRSVEALDTALRRRFSFQPMPPNSDLLLDNEEERMVKGISLKRLLDILNQRIAHLLDEDHQIGHAYFCTINPDDVKQLRQVFRNRIIPLLREYFYNDHAKLRMVLGPGFVSKEERKVSFAEIDDDYLSTDKPTYRVVNIGDDFDIVGALNKTIGG